MEQLRALKIRIYPNKAQETQILKTLGCCRFIYNQMLNEHIQLFQRFKDEFGEYNDEMKRALYGYKYKTEKEYKQEFEWLKEVDSIALQQARIHLLSAYKNFYRRVKNRKPDEKFGFPKFKSKHNKNSYSVSQTNNNIQLDFDKCLIKLPKMSKIKFRDPRRPQNYEIRSATVTRTKTGKYFVSILIKYEVESPKELDLKAKNLSLVGLDMDLVDGWIDDQNNSPAYKRFYRLYEKKLASLEQWKSTKAKGSCYRTRIQKRINRLYEKIANCRKDFNEKQSIQLVRDYDVICIETLSMKQMASQGYHGKSVYDLGWAMFLIRLKQKAEEHGKIVIEASKWFASTKTCNVCGYKNSSLGKYDTEWTCPSCQSKHLRDQNAAKNLRNYGILALQELQEERVDNKSDRVTMHEWQSSLAVA